MFLSKTDNGHVLKRYMPSYVLKMSMCFRFLLRPFQGRKVNFTNSKTLVDVATDRDARYL